jgi:hypothetical protein
VLLITGVVGGVAVALGGVDALGGGSVGAVAVVEPVVVVVGAGVVTLGVGVPVGGGGFGATEVELMLLSVTALIAPSSSSAGLPHASASTPSATQLQVGTRGEPFAWLRTCSGRVEGRRSGLIFGYSGREAERS